LIPLKNPVVTDLKVSPSDWLINPHSINSSWRIWYRFQGKLVKLMGMNHEKNYKKRVLLTRDLLIDEKNKLQKFGYNPLTKSYLIQPPNLMEESKEEPNLLFLDALKIAFGQLSSSHKTLLNVKSCIKYISQSAISIGLDKTPIEQGKWLRILTGCKYR
jgi:hypothetical protein